VPRSSLCRQALGLKIYVYMWTHWEVSAGEVSNNTEVRRTSSQREGCKKSQQQQASALRCACIIN